MPLSPSIAIPTFNLNLGTIIITNTSTGTPVLTHGVVRVTSPTGAELYTAGNNASTFNTPSTATSPDFNSMAGSISINIPLDVNGAPQAGEYTVEMRAWEGTNTIAAPSRVFTYFPLTLPTPQAGDQEDIYNPITAQLYFQDIRGYGYKVNNATPTISRVIAISKVNGLPSSPTPSGWTGWTRTATTTTILDSGILLEFPELYQGAYSYSITSTLTYNFGTFILIGTTSTSKVYNIEADNNICNIFCAVNTLKKQWENAVEQGNTTEANKLYQTLNTASIYINIFNQAYRCMDQDTKNSTLNYLTKILNVTESCCGANSENSQIKLYRLCDCDPMWVQVPANSTSLIAANGYEYKIGDRAYDANYTYLYVGIGQWTRIANQTY